MTSFPYLSIVLAGRHDMRDRRTRDRCLRALRFNDDRLGAAGVPYDLVLVSHAPREPGEPLLADVVRCELPQLNERVTSFDVDPAYEDAFSQGGRRPQEFLARNVGIRRAVGSYILSTNADIYLGAEIAWLVARRGLRPMTLYRAARVDLQCDLDTVYLDDAALRHPHNHCGVSVLVPPASTNGAGDFLLLDRFSWHHLRGFNEVNRTGGVPIGANLCHAALAKGLLLANAEGPVYRATVMTDAPRWIGSEVIPAPAPVDQQVPYDNPESWGLEGAPMLQRAPRDFHIGFTPTVVPPLVALRRIIPPSLRR